MGLCDKCAALLNDPEASDMHLYPYNDIDPTGKRQETAPPNAEYQCLYCRSHLRYEQVGEGHRYHLLREGA